MLPVMFLALGSGASPVAAVQVVAGGKLGWTNTDMVGANDDGISTRNSGLISVIWGWEINPWFSVHAEPAFTQKGADLEGYNFGDLPASLRISYFELPLLAKFKYSMGSDMRGGFFGTIGPAMDFSTQAEARFAGNDTSFNQQINGFDFGLSLGAGYDIPAGPGMATLEARYLVGFLDIFQDSAPRQEVTGDLKNRALQLSVGWYRPIF